MRTSFLSTACFLMFLLFIPTHPWAGQVITDQDKAWARQALEQEQTRKPVLREDTVAVLYFQNTTGMSTLDPLQKGFAFLLMTDLSQIEKIRLVERVKLQALADELDLGASGIVSEETCPRIGRLLGAYYLVRGDIVPCSTAELGIQSDLIAVKDAHYLGQPVAEGSRDDIFTMEKKVLFDIVALLKIELTPEQKARLEKPFTTNLNALLDVVKAMESSDMGDYREAERSYKSALWEDPQFSPAQDGLEELRSLGLVTTPPKRTQVMMQNLQSQISTTQVIGNETITVESTDPGTVVNVQREAGRVKVKW